MESGNSMNDPPPEFSESLQNVDDADFLLEDILPSFEMHNYMFNRTVFDTDNSRNIRARYLPSYEDMTSSTSERVEQANFEPEISHANPTMHPEILILNNLKSSQLIDTPLAITITLTKRFPRFGSPIQKENSLRLYQPGNIVTGHVTVQNTSKEPIPFEMFLVSLEGCATVPQRKIMNSTTTRPPIKTAFLNTYDLSACFHQNVCMLSLHDTQLLDAYVGGNEIYDATDDTYYFLPDSKQLEPGKKYKKTFMFRLPETLLDSACEHQIVHHLSPPPSFGIDRTAFGGSASRISVDRILGYGRLETKGAPIMTKDLAQEGVSISYSINVSCIGKRCELYKKYYNNNTSHEYDFITLKDAKHFFRVGSGVNEGNPGKSEYCFHSNSSTTDQLRSIERLASDKVLFFKEMLELVSSGVTDSEELERAIDSSSVKKQLYSENSFTSAVVPGESSGLQRQGSTNDENLAGFSMISSQTEPEIKDRIRSSYTIRLAKSLFSKTEGRLVLSMSYPKERVIFAREPQALQRLSYSSVQALSKLSPSSPTLGNLGSMKASNCISDSIASGTSVTGSSKETSKTLASSFTSPTSSFSSPYSKLMTDRLSSTLSTQSFGTLLYLEFDLEFKGSTKPPPFPITIKPSLKSIDLKSVSPIPVVFDLPFFTSSSNDPEVHQNNNSIFYQLSTKMAYYLRQISELCSKIQELGGPQRLPKSLFDDLKSLKELSYREVRIASAFQDVKVEDVSWRLINEGIYSAQFKVPLNWNEKVVDGYNIIPSFQSCHVSRLYSIAFALKIPGWKNDMSYVDIPIKIVSRKNN
ncbi:hypothetical protein CANARDRAFT_114982 [[Candida] arabinofermentans NRRL YB-2248]|uniref:Bul1 N-terminal domain-containing protein n=1 Tax=[Candida] arabinofermentans NRRL YB-2248 TaxID=983967 RepID=A0A1E4T512_9ASCO|nr:hypothetical protein CANARDRAFT_114982 [[Candida] arabinofermentans NRRL YB-2248]